MARQLLASWTGRRGRLRRRRGRARSTLEYGTTAPVCSVGLRRMGAGIYWRARRGSNLIRAFPEASGWGSWSLLAGWSLRLSNRSGGEKRHNH
jgi:hypothetical protein